MRVHQFTPSTDCPQSRFDSFMFLADLLESRGATGVVVSYEPDLNLMCAELDFQGDTYLIRSNKIFTIFKNGNFEFQNAKRFSNISDLLSFFGGRIEEWD